MVGSFRFQTFNIAVAIALWYSRESKVQNLVFFCVCLVGGGCAECSRLLLDSCLWSVNPAGVLLCVVGLLVMMVLY